MNLSAAEIAKHLDASVVGNGETLIAGVAPIEKAGSQDITFAVGSKWEKILANSDAGAAIVCEGVSLEGIACIQVTNPQLAYNQVILLFHPPSESFTGISSRAHIAENSIVHEPVSLGPFASVMENSEIGARCRIAAGCSIGRNVTIGEDCRLHANVVIGDGTVIGNRTIIHASTVIGADGFGYVEHQGKQHKIPQVGNVRIGSDVELGAGVCVDRGSLGETLIGDGVKVDNLVQIAHNVKIGDDTIIVSGVGIAGSVTIGKGVIIAGRAGIIEHLNIGDGAVLFAHTLVTHNIEAGTIVAGYPAMDVDAWRRNTVIFRSLYKTWPRLKQLLKQNKPE